MIPKILFKVNIVIVKIRVLFIFIYEIIIIGEIFCHVNNKKHLIQSSPSMREGNHKWNGISLNFINKGINIIILILLINNKDLLINNSNNKIEAKAWIMKYFIEDSIE